MSLHPGSFQFLKKKPETPYKLVEPPAAYPEPFDNAFSPEQSRRVRANEISLTKQYLEQVDHCACAAAARAVVGGCVER